MPDKTVPAFNLWTEPWISVEKPDGGIEQGSIQQVLHVEEFRAIYDPSPLTVVGLDRLLVAILQFVIQPQKDADIKNLWKAGTFPDHPIQAFG